MDRLADCVIGCVQIAQLSAFSTLCGGHPPGEQASMTQRGNAAYSRRVPGLARSYRAERGQSITALYGIIMGFRPERSRAVL